MALAECMNLGHQHPRVIEAIRAQAERLCFVTAAWGAGPRAELAEELLQRSGFDGGRVFFTLGGADANEQAVKFARQGSAKADGFVITRDRSYHGASYAAMRCRATAAARVASIRRRCMYCTCRPVRTAARLIQVDDECGELAAAHRGRDRSEGHTRSPPS
jgi:4-aminobutyrate aminotransferase-like enzyme